MSQGMSPAGVASPAVAVEESSPGNSPSGLFPPCSRWDGEGTSARGNSQPSPLHMLPASLWNLHQTLGKVLSGVQNVPLTMVCLKKISPKHSMNSKLCNCQCSFPEEPLAPDAKDLAVGQNPPTAYLQSRVYSAKAALLPQLAACKVEGLSATDTVHWIYGEWHVLHPVEFSFITQADDQLNPFLSIGCLCNSWSLHCFLPWVPTK